MTFCFRCREDISKITVDQYETVVGRIRSLLEDEYKELTEIQAAAKERAKNLEEALQNGVGTEDTQKHRSALKEIIENISLTIDERVSCQTKKRLCRTYQALIRDNFVVNRFERLNFERDILSPLRKVDTSLGDAAKFSCLCLQNRNLIRSSALRTSMLRKAKSVKTKLRKGLILRVKKPITKSKLR